MVGSRDEQPNSSTPIEFEGALVPDGDAPEAVESGSSTAVRWPIVSLVAALAVVGAVLVWLSPSGDESADAAQQIAPTTTLGEDRVELGLEPAVDEDAAGDTDELSESSERPATLDTIATETIVAEEPFTSVRVETPQQLIQIVSTDRGFVALPEVVPNVVPQLLTSEDGLRWVAVETSLVDAPSPDRPEVAAGWFGILQSGADLAIIGSPVTADGALDILVSQDGAAWSRRSELGPIAEDDRFVVPLEVRDDSIVGFELLDSLELSALPDRLVEVRDAGICGAFQLRPADFTLSDCADFSIGSAPPDEAPPVLVPDCAAASAGGGIRGFSVLEIGPEVDPESPGEASFGSGEQFPRLEALGPDRVGVFDSGNPAIELCDGCLLYTSPSPRDATLSRMPSSA